MRSRGYYSPDVAPAIKKLEEVMFTAQQEREQVLKRLGKNDSEMKRVSVEQAKLTQRHRELNAEIHGYDVALRELRPF